MLLPGQPVRTRILDARRYEGTLSTSEFGYLFSTPFSAFFKRKESMLAKEASKYPQTLFRRQPGRIQGVRRKRFKPTPRIRLVITLTSPYRLSACEVRLSIGRDEKEADVAA